MEWQPIETAPKDGGAVLLWVNDDYEFGCFNRGWHIFNNGYYTDGGYGRNYPCNPSHWMPLPPPPKG